MVKRFFVLCLAVLLVMQGAASAKKNKGLPEEERIQLAIEVTDGTRHKELGTAQNLELFLNDKLIEKNLVSVIDTKIFDEEKFFQSDLILDEEVTAEKKSPAQNIGELLIFDAVELPQPGTVPEDFNQTFYKNFGADYVVRCEVLALGATQVEDKTLSTIFGAAGGITSLIGSGSGKHDKTLRRIGMGIGLGGFIQTKRTALNTVVNMKFISVETGEIVWEQNFTGQAVKHRKPDKDYDDAWTQAYMESVEDAAKKISKRVNKSVDKVIIKGKSDKEFLPKNFSIDKLGGGKLF